MSTSEQPVQIIAFDFDGTITTKDTFALFLRYWAGTPRWAFNLLILLPIFIAYLLNILDRNAVKRHVIKRFFTGASYTAVNERARQFANTVIPGLIRDGALEEIRAKNHPPYTLYIVSASIGPYLRAWASQHQIKHVLATELEKNADKCTGRIDGVNCWGQGKIDKITTAMADSSYIIAEAYGDSPGDEQMLNAAQVSHYKPFRL